MELDASKMTGTIGSWTIEPDDSILCCSTQCERKTECRKYYENNIGKFCVKCYYSFGICGPKGNWRIFDPMDSYGGYMHRFFAGKLNWDDALNYGTAAYMKYIDILVKQELEEESIRGDKK